MRLLLCVALYSTAVRREGGGGRGGGPAHPILTSRLSPFRSTEKAKAGHEQ